MKFSNIAQLAGIVVSTFMTSVESHSWIDNLQVVGGVNGATTAAAAAAAAATPPVPGNPNNNLGYIRGYPDLRADVQLTNRIIQAQGAFACMDTQKTRQQQNPDKPRLSVAPGSLVQGNYTENGHISKPNSPQQQPGTIYWFGTKTPKDNESFEDVLQWTEDGTGGDKRGKLLIKPSSFDDGVCAEENNSPISKARFAAGGGGSCKSVFNVPEDLSDGDVYTVYWFWDFSNHFGARAAPNAPIEWYTSCMDLNIVTTAPKPTSRIRRGAARTVKYRFF